MNTTWHMILLLIAVLASSTVFAEVLHVDVRHGKDSNPGSPQLPLKTIPRALEIIDSAPGPGSSVIKIAPGIYSLEEPATIGNKRAYSENERLIVEAAVLPGDPGWKAESMPVIVSSEYPEFSNNKNQMIEVTGLKVAASHVTIRGLRFTGSPAPKILYYPIFREGKDLEDLVVSQCMFLCDQHVIASNVAILANGHSLKVDHCVFYRCSNAVVFWNAGGNVSRGNSMTHCIVDGGYTSGVWLCQTAEDFEFHHNIVTNCRFAWMRSEGNRNTYRLHDCIISNFQSYSGVCKPDFTLSDTGPEITWIEDNVEKTGQIELEKGQGLDLDIPFRYMNIVKKTTGYGLDAGLFQRNP
ncbi:DUF1565 domain-containing protein [bacterium]|nr:DUF1565 domain-containing protein [bacterium]